MGNEIENTLQLNQQRHLFEEKQTKPNQNKKPVRGKGKYSQSSFNKDLLSTKKHPTQTMVRLERVEEK